MKVWLVDKIASCIMRFGDQFCTMANPHFRCRCDGIIGSSCDCVIKDGNRIQQLLVRLGSIIYRCGNKIWWANKITGDKMNQFDVYGERTETTNLWYRAVLKVSQKITNFGFKLVTVGRKMQDKVPSKHKLCNGDPMNYVGPPIMDDSVKDSLQELLKGRKDLEQLVIKDDPCVIPPIKRGGCEVQLGSFRRVSCIEETK